MEEKVQQNTTPAPQAKAENGQRRGSFSGRRGGQGQGRPNNRRRSFRPEEKLYEEKVVKISRVSKTVKGGKRMRFTALVAIGDGKGKFGYGLGKSTEVPEAIKKALASARKSLYKMQITKNGSITHAVMGQFGATKVFLKPAPEGTGLIAGGAVRAILELAGVKNVYSKIYGSRTQTNAVKATVEGLRQLKTYEEVLTKRYGKTISAGEKK